jgi:hypothetical protein
VLFFLPGQNPDIVAERDGLRRATVPALIGFLGRGSGSADGSSTIDLLENHNVLDREGAGRGLLAVESDRRGGSCGISLRLEVSVSFLRVNHMPELRPWIFIVSFWFISIDPGHYFL